MAVQRKIEVSFRGGGEQEEARNEHSVYARWRDLRTGDLWTWTYERAAFTDSGTCGQ
jgi:hypothetical protein